MFSVLIFLLTTLVPLRLTICALDEDVPSSIPGPGLGVLGYVSDKILLLWYSVQGISKFEN